MVWVIYEKAFQATKARKGKPIRSTVAMVLSGFGLPAMKYNRRKLSMLIAVTTTAARRGWLSKADQRQSAKTATKSAAL
jgi:hypothetical protein